MGVSAVLATDKNLRVGMDLDIVLGRKVPLSPSLEVGFGKTKIEDREEA
jgi:hypothetical protein